MNKAIRCVSVILKIIAVVYTVGLPIVFTLIPPAERIWQWFLLGVVVLVAIEVGRNVLASAERKTAAHFRVVVSNGLAPLLSKYAALNDRTEPGDRRAAVAAIIPLATDVLVGLADPNDTEAQIFRRFDAEKNDNINGHSHFVSTFPVAGKHDRSRRSRSDFSNLDDDARGREVWTFAERQETRRMSGLGPLTFWTPKPAGWSWKKSWSARYKSFITAPILMNGQPIGLLTINSRGRFSLDQHDEDVVNVVARILGSSLERCGDWPESMKYSDTEGIERKCSHDHSSNRVGP